MAGCLFFESLIGRDCSSGTIMIRSEWVEYGECFFLFFVFFLILSPQSLMSLFMRKAWNGRPACSHSYYLVISPHPT